ncbi:hypothetical protein POM88_015797 [Heracleum sosnowskyi]|uniref:Uncharacterized protein n=1 Tax=Heracleum sosnowskyi TaxID=360622 RepID=A0AAD8MWJ0_9APIA|nr:hypothetical protein POM88_015797 [Heracleum sosnowskyi]
MGCKESKHKAVAEGNTIITPSSSGKSLSRGQSSSIKSHSPSLQRSRSTRSSIQKQDSLKKINVGDSKASNVLKENGSGYEKGTVNVSKVLESEDRRLKELNDQMAKSEEKESISIPEIKLPLSPRKDGEGIDAIITDGLSGTSAYYTPTETSGPFGNKTNTNSDEEKQESVEEKQEPVEEKQESTEEKQQATEEIKDTKSDVAEEAAEDNPIKTVDATPVNNVEEAEVAEKNTIETDDVTPENHEEQAEVTEKIKVAEAAIAALETLLESDKTEYNDAATQNPVKEAEESTDATLEKPVIEAEKSDIVQETESASTDATLQSPVKEAEKFEEITEIEPEATDATLSYPVIEFDNTEEILLKEEAEAVENAVKEIHEVADKVEETPAKEAKSSDPTNHENQELVSDKNEDVQGKEVEAASATPNDPVKEVEVADQVKNLVNEAEAVSVHEETPVQKLENMMKDEANTEEDTKNSSTANVQQMSTEDPDNK